MADEVLERLSDIYGNLRAFRGRPPCEHAIQEIVRRLRAEGTDVRDLESHWDDARDGDCDELARALEDCILETQDLGGLSWLIHKYLHREDLTAVEFQARLPKGLVARLAAAPPASTCYSMKGLVYIAIELRRLDLAVVLMEAVEAADKDLSTCECVPDECPCAPPAVDCTCSLYYAAARTLDPEVFGELLRRRLLPGDESFNGVGSTRGRVRTTVCLVGCLALKGPRAAPCLELLFGAGVPRLVRQNAGGPPQAVPFRDFVGGLTGVDAAWALELDAEFSRWTELRATWIAATLWRARA